MTLDGTTERRLRALVALHQGPGLSEGEVAELRATLARDNPYVRDLETDDLVRVARTTIGAQVLMRVIDQLPVPPIPA